MPCFTAELCWRVHLLSPFIYAKYCRKNFGKIVDHVTLPVGEYPIEPPDHPSPAKPLLASFLVPAIRRQQDFMEKMLARRGAMESPEAIAAAVESYGKFLGLMKRHPGVTFVPTLAIDLIWHTHQYHPVRYAAECQAVAGRAINHDDSIEDGNLAEGLSQTERLWEIAYGQPYLRPAPAPPAPSVGSGSGSGSGLKKKLLRIGIMLLAGLTALVGGVQQQGSWRRAMQSSDDEDDEWFFAGLAPPLQVIIGIVMFVAGLWACCCLFVLVNACCCQGGGDGDGTTVAAAAAARAPSTAGGWLRKGQAHEQLDQWRDVSATEPAQAAAPA